jgi:thiol-disulfide isomerase/thioredoxin
MNVKNWTAIGLALSCAATTAWAAPPSRTVNQMGPLKVGRPCPSFAGLTLESQTLSLSKLLAPDKGTPVAAAVISFFATHCKACKAQLPVIERVVASSKDVRGVLIDFGEDPDVVAPFVEAQKLTLPVIPDKFTKIAARLGVDGTLPRSLVVDGHGYVSAIFEHEGDDFEKALRAAIEAARNAQ